MPRVSKDAKRMDYEAIYKYLSAMKITAKEMAEMCGKSRSWLSVAKSKDSRMTPPMIRLLARNLAVNPEDIILEALPVTSDREVAQEVDVEDLTEKVEDLTRQVESLVSAVNAALDTMTDKINLLTETVSIQQDDILSVLAGTNRIASAVAIANAMFQASGRCKETRFREACSKRGIGTDEMRRALEDVGAHYVTVGKGAQAVRWIVKERITA